MSHSERFGPEAKVKTYSLSPSRGLMSNQKSTTMTKYQLINEAIQKALAELDERQGKEGFTKPYDKALHVIVAIEKAGFSIRKNPVREAENIFNAKW
jgi:hypothetical protein